VLKCHTIVQEPNKTAFVSSSSLQQLNVSMFQGRAISHAVRSRIPTAAARVRTQVSSCGICGGLIGTEADFLRVLRFPLPFSFYRLLHTHHLSSGAGTIGQLVADVQSGHSLTLRHETKKQKLACSSLSYDSISSFVSPHLYCRIL
jgi:hypothetical protein